MSRSITLIFALALSMPAWAQLSDTRLWSGELQTGAVLTGGNTDLQRFNGTLSVQRNGDTIRNVTQLEGLYALNSGNEVARRYSLSNQADYKLTPRSYLFNKLRYDSDRFGPFASNFLGSVGYGYRFLMTARHQLSTEAGVGYRELRRADFGPSAGEVIGEELLLVSANYRWRPQPRTSFSQVVSAEMSADRTQVRSISRFQAMVTDRASVSVAYDRRFNSAVPEPFSQTDTTTTINLGYLF